MTNTDLKILIDTGITGKVDNSKIVLKNIAESLKSVVDYADQLVTKGIAGPTGPQGPKGDSIQGPKGEKGDKGDSACVLPITSDLVMAGADFENSVLQYDYNTVKSLNTSHKVVLPENSEIGKEVFVFVTNNMSCNLYATINNDRNLSLQGVETLIGNFPILPNTGYRFIKIAEGIWKVEAFGANLQQVINTGNTISAGTKSTTLNANSITLASPGQVATITSTDISLDSTSGSVSLNSTGVKITSVSKYTTDLKSLDTTASRLINLPDKDGTIALIEDLNPTKVSQQVNATIPEFAPEIKDIDFIRLTAISANLEVKLTGPHILGKEYYIKNISEQDIIIRGVNENINGVGSITIPPKTYLHLIKEDNSTPSITAFKLNTI